MKKIKNFFKILMLVFLFTSQTIIAKPTNITVDNLKQKYLYVDDNDTIKEKLDKLIELQKEKKDLQQGIYAAKLTHEEELLKNQENKMNKVENEIKNIQISLNKTKEKLRKINIDNLYTYFNLFLQEIGKYIIPIALMLIKLFGILELLNLAINRPTEFPIAPISKIFFKGCILYFLVTFSLEFQHIFINDIKKMGIYIGSLGQNNPIVEFSPNNIYLYYGKPFLNTFIGLSGWNPLNFGLVILSIAGIVISFLIALEYLMAILEFYLMFAFSIFLLPLNMWQHTQSIGIRIVGIYAFQFFKLLSMFIFLGMGFSCIPNLGEVSFGQLYGFGSKLEGMAIMITLIGFCYIILILLRKSTSFASMLVGGGSSMSGQDAIAPMLRASAAALGTAFLAFRINALGADKNGNGGLIQNGIGKLARATKNVFTDKK